jgi:DNA-binding transcriptional MerR regulator
VPGAALPPIPDKLFFKIGEVARLVDVKPHVLRYWETEFSQIRPTKSGNGYRVYARADVERLRQVRTLLYDRGFTLAGVRGLLAQGGAAVEAALALRPTEAAQEAEALERTLREREREVAATRSEVQALRRELADAREEAAFWRDQVRAARTARPEVLERLRAQVQALRDWAEPRNES